MEGFPRAGFGQSELARNWENASDKVIRPEQARTFLNTRNWETNTPTIENNPWLAKVPPETTVYDLSASMRPEYLGFDHLIDELRNATNPASGLPKELLIDPADLGKITMKQAVERVSDINAWRAAQKVEANKALANNPATFTHKEFPEQGMKWVQLRQPEEMPDISDMLVQNLGKYSIVEPGQKLGWKGGWKDPSSGRVLFDTPESAAAAYGKSKNYKSLEDALKHEGDIMAHCVGGYCPDVSSGKSQIFSLRDTSGRSHVTIETRPGRSYGSDHLNAQRPQAESEGLANGLNPNSAKYRTFVNTRMDELARANNPDRIIQIKGLGNKKPADEYLPFVQDFVKSGTWSDVGDLQNTGLVRGSELLNDSLDPMFSRAKALILEQRPDLTMPREEMQKLLSGNYFSTPEEVASHVLNSLPKAKGFARGGSVNSSSTAYDPSRVDQIMNSIHTQRNYAEGGSVRAYDPGRVDAIVKQFM
jgi:hypothetical protein